MPEFPLGTLVHLIKDVSHVHDQCTKDTKGLVVGISASKGMYYVRFEGMTKKETPIQIYWHEMARVASDKDLPSTWSRCLWTPIEKRTHQ